MASRSYSRSKEEIAEPVLDALLKAQVDKDPATHTEWMAVYSNCESVCGMYKNLLINLAQKTDRLNVQTVRKGILRIWPMNFDLADMWSQAIVRAFRNCREQATQYNAGHRKLNNQEPHSLAVIAIMAGRSTSRSPSPVPVAQREPKQKCKEEPTSSIKEVGSPKKPQLLLPGPEMWESPPQRTLGSSCKIEIPGPDLWDESPSLKKIKKEELSATIEQPPSEKAVLARFPHI